jgi:LysR family transcriptional regulator, cys regulon transcriptional activator
MKLQQLRFLAAVAQNDLNMTVAAAELRTTQPAVSKQLRLLEDELGFTLFMRSGRTLSRATQQGERVIQSALRIMREVHNIRSISAEHRDENRGTLSIGTTHTQARYVLPPVIREFRERYPHVQFHLHQGTSEQIAEMARTGRIDLAIATGARNLFEHYVLLPCYRWHRMIVVPTGHPLTQLNDIGLQQLASYPIVTYVFSFSGPSSLHEAFAAVGLKPTIALTARDADIIKTYVRLGMGVGLVAEMALEAAADSDLVSIDASRLFPVLTTWVGFARDTLLRRYVYDFLGLFAPHLTRDLVDRASHLRTQSEVDSLLESVSLRPQK